MWWMYTNKMDRTLEDHIHVSSPSCPVSFSFALSCFPSHVFLHLLSFTCFPCRFFPWPTTWPSLIINCCVVAILHGWTIALSHELLFANSPFLRHWLCDTHQFIIISFRSFLHSDSYSPPNSLLLFLPQLCIHTSFSYLISCFV